MSTEEEMEQEAGFFREVMDPYVRTMLDTEDPWEAYQSVAKMRAAMIDYLEWGPHGGAVFVAWADLEDLYDTGKTPTTDAHAALRQAATDWLARPIGPTASAYIEEWIAEVGRSLSAFVERDGGFWSNRE